MSRGLASFSNRRAFFRQGARAQHLIDGVENSARIGIPDYGEPQTKRRRRLGYAGEATPPSRSGVLRRIDEGVGCADSEAAEFAEVSRQEDEAVANRRRSDDEVGQSDRLAMGAFAEPSEMPPGLDVHSKNAIGEIGQYGGNQQRQLIGPLCLSLTPHFEDARVHFYDRHDRQENASAVAIDPIDERSRVHLAAGIEHRYDIRVEQIPNHAKSPPSGRSAQGRSTIASSRAPSRACRANSAPSVGAPRRAASHASSETITTAFLPCRVTRCGSPAKARSTSLENSARAALSG